MTTPNDRQREEVERRELFIVADTFRRHALGQIDDTDVSRLMTNVLCRLRDSASRTEGEKPVVRKPDTSWLRDEGEKPQLEAGGGKPKCSRCGKLAACLGQYEGHGEPEYACNDCCGHGNEDGKCFMLPSSDSKGHDKAAGEETTLGPSEDSKPKGFTPAAPFSDAEVEELAKVIGNKMELLSNSAQPDTELAEAALRWFASRQTKEAMSLPELWTYWKSRAESAERTLAIARQGLEKLNRPANSTWAAKIAEETLKKIEAARGAGTKAEGLQFRGSEAPVKATASAPPPALPSALVEARKETDDVTKWQNLDGTLVCAAVNTERLATDAALAEKDTLILDLRSVWIREYSEKVKASQDVTKWKARASALANLVRGAATGDMTAEDRARFDAAAARVMRAGADPYSPEPK